MLENVNRHFEATDMLRAPSKLDPALAVLILATAALQRRRGHRAVATEAVAAHL